MNTSQLLTSLAEQERDFIAGLDYGNEQAKHRAALDLILQSDGIVNFAKQGYWYPYEVIELGKNWLQPNHEREYAACMTIVLKNMLSGGDTMNDIEFIVETQSESISQLPTELRDTIEKMIGELIGKSESNPEPCR